MTAASIVICTHTMERWDLLEAAVASVHRQTHPAHEVIVVVDHAADVAARAKAALSDVRVVDNAGRRGLAGARNTGVAATTGEVVAFLDDDAEADDHWLEHLLAPYTRAGVLGVGGTVRPRWEHGRPGWFPKEFDWVVGCTYDGMPVDQGRLRNLIGANMSFRRDVLDTVGPFRDDMGRIGSTPLGCEETELCLRVQRRFPHAELCFAPAAVVAHTVPSARATVRYFRSRCWAEGLSKATVAARAGARDGLRSERTYTLKTLPRAAGRGLVDAVMRRDPTGLARSAAIGAGLFTTVGGFAAGRLHRERDS